MVCRQLALCLWLCLHLQEEKKQDCNRGHLIQNKLSINKYAICAPFSQVLHPELIYQQINQKVPYFIKVTSWTGFLVVIVVDASIW